MTSAPRSLAVAAFRAAGGARIIAAAADRWMIAGGARAARIRRRACPPFQILIYHRVQASPGPFMIDAIPADRFDRQMRHLARHYRPMPLEDLVARSERGEVPPRAVAVTFDDGYADNCDVALPILRRHRIPATVFLVTGCVGTGRVPWHDEVLLAFQRAPAAAARLPGDSADTRLEDLAARRRAAFRTLEALKRLDDAARRAAIAALTDALGAGSEPADGSLMLDWSQVRAMRDSGIRFGSHTVTHPILSRVSPARAHAELADSKAALEAALGEEVTLLAYPNGRAPDVTPANVEQARALGYRAAVTTAFGPNEAGSDPMRLRRGTPWSEDPARFEVQLALHRLRAPAPPDPPDPKERS